ncbi:hypothetical protein K435DRAFT_793206 [Dendrothele bispora CBS 962.96]|uniref:Uncharacterized protein n=1 Tax=Dendrothele bispora (strain CBS 962.96) TaxID=1314807 RepID=A0A4V4HH67_DENBC|nr:hypothetical protein K435DRAFT_793206 [Dendrothele bispora CBS 962.96]
MSRSNPYSFPILFELVVTKEVEKVKKRNNSKLPEYFNFVKCIVDSEDVERSPVRPYNRTRFSRGRGRLAQEGGPKAYFTTNSIPKTKMGHIFIIYASVPPNLAHVSVLLNADGKKMSGGVQIVDYIVQQRLLLVPMDIMDIGIDFYNQRDKSARGPPLVIKYLAPFSRATWTGDYPSFHSTIQAQLGVVLSYWTWCPDISVSISLALVFQRPSFALLLYPYIWSRLPALGVFMGSFYAYKNSNLFLCWSFTQYSFFLANVRSSSHSFFVVYTSVCIWATAFTFSLENILGLAVTCTSVLNQSAVFIFALENTLALVLFFTFTLKKTLNKLVPSATKIVLSTIRIWIPRETVTSAPFANTSRTTSSLEECGVLRAFAGEEPVRNWGTVEGGSMEERGGVEGKGVMPGTSEGEG